MSNRIVAAIAAGALAVGLVVGAAGSIVVREATTNDSAGAWWGGMGTMGGPMMGGPMMGGPMMDGDLDDMVELHRQHHADAR